jgi:hypothetical protein
MNVLLGPTGPVVIDGPNARRGSGATDVALTWVLMAAGEIPAGRLEAALLGRARRVSVDGFVGCVDLAAVRAWLRAIVQWRVADPNMSAAEQKRMWDVALAADARGPV